MWWAGLVRVTQINVANTKTTSKGRKCFHSSILPLSRELLEEWRGIDWDITYCNERVFRFAWAFPWMESSSSIFSFSGIVMRFN